MWYALALLAAWIVGCDSSQPAASPEFSRSTVRVAAASDLTYALDAVIERFEARWPAIDVQVSYGSSGNFCTQLLHGAPYDVFFSADIAYPRQLIDANIGDGETEFHYAVGRLVIWVRKDSPLSLEQHGIKTLTESNVRKIAIANPRHAPYGQAAAQALEHFGLTQQLESKLVFGDNVAQAAQFVESGHADAGLIALSLAVAPAMQTAGRFWEVPLEAYQRLDQGGVILRKAADRDAALRFRAFVASDEGRSILADFGFRLAEE